MTRHCARRLVTHIGAVTGVTAWIVAGPAEDLTARCPAGEHSTLPSTGSAAAEPAARPSLDSGAGVVTTEAGQGPPRPARPVGGGVLALLPSLARPRARRGA